MVVSAAIASGAGAVTVGVGDGAGVDVGVAGVEGVPFPLQAECVSIIASAITDNGRRLLRRVG